MGRRVSNQEGGRAIRKEGKQSGRRASNQEGGREGETMVASMVFLLHSASTGSRWVCKQVGKWVCKQVGERAIRKEGKRAKLW